MLPGQNVLMKSITNKVGAGKNKIVRESTTRKKDGARNRKNIMRAEMEFVGVLWRDECQSGKKNLWGPELIPNLGARREKNTFKT